MPRLILQSKPTPLASKRADLMHEQENGTWHEICMIYERPKGSRHQLKERFFRFVMWFKFFLEYSNKTRKKGLTQSRKVTPSSPFLLIMGVFHVIFSWYLCLRQIMLKQSKSCKFPQNNAFEFFLSENIFTPCQKHLGISRSIGRAVFATADIDASNVAALRKNNNRHSSLRLTFFFRKTNNKFPR